MPLVKNIPTVSIGKYTRKNRLAYLEGQFKRHTLLRFFGQPSGAVNLEGLRNP